MAIRYPTAGSRRTVAEVAQITALTERAIYQAFANARGVKRVRNGRAGEVFPAIL